MAHCLPSDESSLLRVPLDQLYSVPRSLLGLCFMGCGARLLVESSSKLDRLEDFSCMLPYPSVDAPISQA